jgi:hypothetical protein
VPRIELTSHLARHVECPPETVEGATLIDALEASFARHPRVREYVLDEQGLLRRHVVIFIGENQAHDRKTLRDPVLPDQIVYVMQALSGG